MDGSQIVLYVTLGFTLICFVAWLWQSIVKRRRLEDELADRREQEGGEAGAADKSDGGARKG